MTVMLPTHVEKAAGSRDMGDSRLTLRPKSNNLVVTFDAVVLVILVIILLVSSASGGAAGATLEVLSILLGVAVAVHLVATLIFRRIYLYDRGVVTTGWRRQIKEAQLWRDVDVHWRRVHYPASAMVAPFRDQYRCQNGRHTVFTHNEPQDVADGKLILMLGAAERTTFLRDRLSSGEPLDFGLFTVTRSALIHRGKPLPWAEIKEVYTEPDRFGSARVFLRAGKPIIVVCGKVPNFLAFAQIVNDLAEQHQPDGAG